MRVSLFNWKKYISNRCVYQFYYLFQLKRFLVQQTSYNDITINNLVMRRYIQNYESLDF